MDDAQDIIDFEEQQTENNFSQRNFNPALAALRAQNPFIPFLPFPNTVLSVKLVANQVTNVAIPDQVKLLRIQGEYNKDYWVNRNAAAKIPTNTSVDVFANDSTGSMLSPNGIWFYVEEVKDLSFIAGADTLISISCFTQL